MMKKVKEFWDGLTGRIGKKLFPGADEKTGKRRAAWLLILLLSAALMCIYQYKATQELRQYQRIMETYSILFR